MATTLAPSGVLLILSSDLFLQVSTEPPIGIEPMTTSLRVTVLIVLYGPPAAVVAGRELAASSADSPGSAWMRSTGTHAGTQHTAVWSLSCASVERSGGPCCAPTCRPASSTGPVVPVAATSARRASTRCRCLDVRRSGPSPPPCGRSTSVTPSDMTPASRSGSGAAAARCRPVESVAPSPSWSCPRGGQLGRSRRRRPCPGHRRLAVGKSGRG